MIVIHHNPDCGTSRNVLAFVEAAGYTPEVILYLETGWTRPQLLGLLAAADLTPRAALRTSKCPAESLGLLQPSVTDDTLLKAMLEHPVLVNRPFVCTPKGVRLCRPSEIVLDLLDRWPMAKIYIYQNFICIICHKKSHEQTTTKILRASCKEPNQRTLATESRRN